MAKDIVVTVTPGGTVTDVMIGGHSVGGSIPRAGVTLTLGAAGAAPLLSLTLVPGEIVVKEPQE